MGVVILITLTLLLSVSISASGGPHSSNVIASVTVPAVCGITLSATTIDFGSLAPGIDVPTNNAIIDSNTGGDIAVNVLLVGNDWTSTSSSFSVSNTVYSAAIGTPYSTATKLTNILVITPYIVGPYTSNTIYFGLGIPQTVLKGSYTQNILIENSC